MDRPPPPQPPKAAETGRHLRSEPRDSMFLLAVARRPNGPDVSVKLRNLSPGGMMAECAGGFVRGDVIHIDLRGIGTVPGKVAWTTSGRIGVKFDNPIDHRSARVAPSTPQPPLLKVKVAKTLWRPAVR